MGILSKIQEIFAHLRHHDDEALSNSSREDTGSPSSRGRYRSSSLPQSHISSYATVNSTNVSLPTPSSAGSLNRRHSSDSSQLVTQVDLNDQPIAAAGGTKKSNNSATSGRRRARGAPAVQAPADAHVAEMHPSSVSLRCKPNDFILLYRDLSELGSSMVGYLTFILWLISCNDTDLFNGRLSHLYPISNLS